MGSTGAPKPPPRPLAAAESTGPMILCAFVIFMPLPKSPLRARLDAVKKAILITDLQIDTAQFLRRREEVYSNMGWFLSIVAGAPGTVLAVLKGRDAKRCGDVVFDLEESRIRLLIEKSHLEHELGEADPDHW